MVRSTRNLISLVIVTITSAHLVEGSFTKLYGEFPYSTSTLKKCQTCLLEQAGATRLILMKKTITGTIAQKTVNFEYQTQGPSYFYSNVETYCVGRQYCGILAIGATQPYHEAKEATEAKPEQSYDKRYQCLLRFSLAHSLSCFRTLKELSGSELMGDFLLRSPLYDHDLHLFLLFTSKNLKEMTGHYFPAMLVMVTVLFYQVTHVTHLSRIFFLNRTTINVFRDRHHQNGIKQNSCNDMGYQ